MEKLHTDNPIPEGIPAYTFRHGRKPAKSFSDTQEVIRLLNSDEPQASHFLTKREPSYVHDVFATVRADLEAGMLRLLLEFKNTGLSLQFHRSAQSDARWTHPDGTKRSFVFPKNEIKQYASLENLKQCIAEAPDACHVLDYIPGCIGNHVILAMNAKHIPVLEKYVDGIDGRNHVHNGIMFTGKTMFDRFQEWMKIAGIPGATEVKQEREIS